MIHSMLKLLESLGFDANTSIPGTWVSIDCVSFTLRQDYLPLLEVVVVLEVLQGIQQKRVYLFRWQTSNNNDKGPGWYPLCSMIRL